MEARCDFGILFFCSIETEDGDHLLEVKCRSARCGAEPGVVVLHRFTVTGELHSTQRYRDPGVRKEKDNDHHSRSAALRSA